MKFKFRKPFFRFIAILTVLTLLTVYSVEAYSASYVSTYSVQGTLSNYSYTAYGNCNEFRGNLKTTYDKSAYLKLNVKGYYIQSNDTHSPYTRGSGTRTYSVTAPSIAVNVYPSTFGNITMNYSAMCKTTTDHSISGTVVASQKTAQFQAW